MINTDYPNDVKSKVMQSIRVIFASCLTDQERFIGEIAIVECLTVMQFTAEECIDVLKRSDGQDAETDACIDRMISEFESE